MPQRTIRFSETTIKQIRQAARQKGLTSTAIVRHAVEQALSLPTSVRAALRYAQGGNQQHCRFFPRQFPQECDEAAVGRPGGTVIDCRIRGYPKRWPTGADQLDVYIAVVPLLTIPRESYLVAVRRESGLSLRTRISGQGDSVPDGFRNFGC